MDVLQHFVFNGEEHNITILWDEDDPWFRASEIGDVIGVKEIRSVIRDFDKDEKGVRTMHTPGGPQEVVFLSETGVYRMLFQSRKPIAKPFQKWVAHVIKELRKNGRYQIETLEQEAEENKKRIKMADHNALVAAYRDKNVVYFGRIRKIGDKTLVKMGKTDDIHRRSGELKETFGSVEFFHVFEMPQNQRYEKFLRKHEKIKVLQYTEPYNDAGARSNELYLMTEKQIQSVIDIAKRNMHKFHGLPADGGSVSANIYNLQEKVNEMGDQMKHIMTKVDVMISGNSQPETKEQNNDTVQHHPTDDRKHTQGRGPKIQRYSADGKRLLKTYDSAISALRDPELDSPTRSQLMNAATTNVVYKGFRWATLLREQGDDTVQELTPTVVSKVIKKGLVAMLSLDKSQIVKVFPGMKEAAEDRQFKGCAAITKAVKTGSRSGGHYFQMWYDCDDDMKEAYLAQHKELPMPRVTKKSKTIERVDKDGNVKSYSSVSAVLKEFQMSRSTLYSAIEEKYALRGFMWRNGE